KELTRTVVRNLKIEEINFSFWKCDREARKYAVELLQLNQVFEVWCYADIFDKDELRKLLHSLSSSRTSHIYIKEIYGNQTVSKYQDEWISIAKDLIEKKNTRTVSMRSGIELVPKVQEYKPILGFM
ncbi:hypothetical protein PMAYCL1PPCAC_26551, partial [Pristionchus mayeri]